MRPGECAGVSPLRIAILCHSTNPRGGVAHALDLAASLLELGHEPTVLAPDPRSAGFFRESTCRTESVSARRYEGGVVEMVEARVADYLAYFDDPRRRRFDVFHAQDGISANALARLKQDGRIERFARTVHHVDRFDDARLEALQRRAIVAADAHFVVSDMWRSRLSAEYGVTPDVVGNGVDVDRFSPKEDGREVALRERLGLGAGPVVLSVGGVERRKNTRAILEAFRQIERIMPAARLVIAGGVSLLDHSDYHAEFARDIAASDLPAEAVILAGAVDDADMPALYRVADVLAFPSIAEGFGLAVLEAMASGLPVAVSHIPPFTEYLGDDDAAWCDPGSAGSIANALMAALAEPLRSRFAEGGTKVAARHGWRDVAARHLPVYERLTERAHA